MERLPCQTDLADDTWYLAVLSICLLHVPAETQVVSISSVLLIYR